MNHLAIEVNLCRKKPFPLPQNLDENFVKLVSLCTNTDADLRINPNSIIMLLEKIIKKEDISVFIPNEENFI